MQSSGPKAADRRPEPIRISLVDDDALFREALGANLTDEGFDVTLFGGGRAALDFFRGGGTSDICLLDWRMPDLDGITVLRSLRDAGIDVPVIFLTVLSDQIYEEAALSGGAIDFVEKSRSLPILLRRMRLILDGRKGAARSEPAAAQAEDRAEDATGPGVPGLHIDLRAGAVDWRGHPMELTVTEIKIVAALAGQSGQNLTYREIYDLVRGSGFVAGYGIVGYRSNVRAFIKRIRQKFKAVDPDFDEIENYPGYGYRWRAADG